MDILKKESVDITNKTMELADCMTAWFYDETYGVWCLEDILYTSQATVPKFQRLSIFVPKQYMCAPGQIDKTGKVNRYTAETAPVIFANNSAGYMQMPHVYLGGPRETAMQYMKQGYVYVTCGNRGHESRDSAGNYVGKAPANLIDLKTAIRFLRHNRDCIPGDLNKIISVGSSAGGAMSSLLAVTGDNENYRELLLENGAFMEESDRVYAAQIYCPVTDLEHADLAYEWMFQADKENEDSPAGPREVMTPFKEALSQKLAACYIAYFNSLGLKDLESGEVLTLNPDGRSGSGYDFLIKKLSESATVYLNKLAAGQLDVSYTVEDYLSGNYTYKVPAAFRPPKRPPIGAAPMEPPGLGHMLARPPKGMPLPPSFKPPMETRAGQDKHEWLFWDGKKACIRNLDDYVLKYRRRMKPCTSFDVFSGLSGENKVYGTKDVNAIHFSTYVPEIMEELKEEFPMDYEKYYREFAEVFTAEGLEERKYLINPLNYIGTEEMSKQAEFYRIRVGASDADTSLSVSMTLACKLGEAGKNVDYQIVWEQPHCEADYPGEIIAWIEAIV